MQITKEKKSIPSVRTRVPIPMANLARSGTFITFNDLDGTDEHFCIKLGPDTPEPMVRIHSECVTGDLFGSLKCDCGEQLQEALERITEHGGYLFYMRQEGRGIGLYAKLEAYVLQSRGYDTFEANRALGFRDDLRSYLPAAQMLHALGAPRIKLLTNNPDKVSELEAYGIKIIETLRTGVFSNPHNNHYLRAKADALHTLNLQQPTSRTEGFKK